MLAKELNGTGNARVDVYGNCWMNGWKTGLFCCTCLQRQMWENCITVQSWIIVKEYSADKYGAWVIENEHSLKSRGILNKRETGSLFSLFIFFNGTK